MPAVSILIPVYNNPQLLGRCLNSIRAQVFKDYEIIVVDDCSSITYDKVLTDNADLPVKYIVNAQNIGAMQNLNHCLRYAVNGVYKMVFHEDDMMHPYLLQSLFNAMEADASLFGAGTEMKFFRDDYELQDADFIAPEIKATTYHERAKLVYDFVTGLPLCFGSILYRTQCLTGSAPLDLNKYQTFADRPFLINFLPAYKFAVLHNNLVFYNEHYRDDIRTAGVHSNHVLNFFEFYRRQMGNSLSGGHYKQAVSNITKQALDSYSNIGNHNFAKLVSFIIAGFGKKVLNGKYFLYHTLYKRR